jgi:hypothetical protein
VELASCWARLRAGRVGRKEADRMHRKRRQTTIFGKPRKCVRAAAAAFGLLASILTRCARVGSWLIHTAHGTASSRLFRID